MFALVEKAIDAKPFGLFVKSGANTGVPTQVSVDETVLGVDDVSGSRWRA